MSISHVGSRVKKLLNIFHALFITFCSVQCYYNIIILLTNEQMRSVNFVIFSLFSL